MTGLKPRPPLVKNFVGREDILEAMRQTHLTKRSTKSHDPTITVLSGLGGAGKTQVALKFALEFEDK
jgi:signal recognition particle GTPase